MIRARDYKQAEGLKSKPAAIRTVWSRQKLSLEEPDYDIAHSFN